jgi:serine phosphatase RsbU (regulator of sigma subunit)
MKFEAAECSVEPGSRLYVLTDGVCEVRRADASYLPYEDVRAELSRLEPRGQVLERALELAYTTEGTRIARRRLHAPGDRLRLKVVTFGSIRTSS